MSDSAGDATPHDAQPATSPVSVDELDILAVDLSSDSKTLTVTVRMAAIRPTPIPHRLLTVLLPNGNDMYQAYWYLGVDGQRFVFTNGKGDHDVVGSADPTSGLVRFRVPRTLLPRNVHTLSADANMAVLAGTNTSAAVLTFDLAGSNRLHRLGTRGCL